jgi:hypothetical protein
LAGRREHLGGYRKLVKPEKLQSVFRTIQSRQAGGSRGASEQKTRPDQVPSLKCDRGVNAQNACLGLDVHILSTPEVPLVLHFSPTFPPTRSLTKCHPSHLPSPTTTAVAQTGEPTLLPLLCPAFLFLSDGCGVRAAARVAGRLDSRFRQRVRASQIPITIAIGRCGVTLCDAHVGTVMFVVRSFTSGPPKAPTNVWFTKKNLIRIIFFNLGPNFIRIIAHT